MFDVELGFTVATFKHYLNGILKEGVSLDPKALVRKGVAEALEVLSENSEGVKASELKEKTSISKKTL